MTTDNYFTPFKSKASYFPLFTGSSLISTQACTIYLAATCLLNLDI